MDEKTLKAIGDTKRFLLLKLMSERSYCVRALARKSELSESAVSQHLKILREAGLVYGVKRGYYTHYSVDKDALAGVISEFQEMLNVPASLLRVLGNEFQDAFFDFRRCGLRVCFVDGWQVSQPFKSMFFPNRQ